MSALAAGDRVAVTDAGLAELRAIMRRYGNEPKPNHLGVIDHVKDETAYIVFDDGGMAPYPLDECVPEAEAAQ